MKPEYIETYPKPCETLSKSREWVQLDSVDRGGDRLFDMTQDEFRDAMDAEVGEQAFKRMMEARRQGDKLEAFEILEKRMRDYIAEGDAL